MHSLKSPKYMQNKEIMCVLAIRHIITEVLFLLWNEDIHSTCMSFPAHFLPFESIIYVSNKYNEVGLCDVKFER